jgi:pimeloyl-ACP methyl ester carboxylesterase
MSFDLWALASSTPWLMAGTLVLHVAFLALLRVRLPRMILAVGTRAPAARDDEAKERTVRGVTLVAAGHRFGVLDVPPTAPRCLGTVVAVHGIHHDAASLVEFADRAAARGFRCLLPDLPGFGDPSVARSYGVEEGRVLAEMLENPTLAVRGPVLAVGFSYGGAVCCQLAAKSDRVVAVASIAGFSDLFHAVRDRLPSVLPAPWLARTVPAAVIRGAVEAAARRGNFTTSDADAAAALARSGVPFLALHGSADDVLPLAHSERLAAAAGPQAEIFVEDGADHVSVFASETVRGHLLDWLERTAIAADAPIAGRGNGRPLSRTDAS